MYSILFDKKSDCYSIVTTYKLKDYLSLADKAYSDGGGIDGQRKPVSSKSAKRIRSRMVDDFMKGAVLPPVVIGAASNNLFNSLNDSIDQKNLYELLEKIDDEKLAIIDGMQRTTAMQEALQKTTDSEEREALENRDIRVEVWISKDTSSLIYRMLVLNTGQVPWNLRRQLEVILRPLKSEIEKTVNNIRLISIDESEYRKVPGSFQADRILELYLIFASRKEKIDAKEQVAEEYARLDIIEISSRESLINMFCELLNRIVQLDQILWSISKVDDGRFKEGKDFFNSQPALASLVSVIAQYILGRPGWDNEADIVRKREEILYSGFDNFISRINTLTPDDKKEFMDFETLNEVLGSIKSGKVGDAERDFFRRSFKTLIEEKFDIPNMSICWRS